MKAGEKWKNRHVGHIVVIVRVEMVEVIKTTPTFVVVFFEENDKEKKEVRQEKKEFRKHHVFVSE